MPNVRLGEETYTKLKEFKGRMGHESFDGSIRWLLDRATDPKQFLESFAFFIKDLSEDVKGIRRALQAFEHMLKEKE